MPFRCLQDLRRQHLHGMAKLLKLSELLIDFQLLSDAFSGSRGQFLFQRGLLLGKLAIEPAVFLQLCPPGLRGGDIVRDEKS